MRFFSSALMIFCLTCLDMQVAFIWTSELLDVGYNDLNFYSERIGSVANSYKINQRVAEAYVKGEQMKGWFLAQARYLVIFLSGAMLFLGVVLLFGNLHFAVS